VQGVSETFNLKFYYDQGGKYYSKRSEELLRDLEVHVALLGCYSLSTGMSLNL